MPRILVLFAHPALERSRVNTSLIAGLDDHPAVTFRDLYELYPDFYIDVRREQEELLKHDWIVWHFPLYWYSVPPLLKQWIDLTLEHGWAYGKQGIYLKGKKVFCALTTGGAREAYCSEGYNTYTIQEFLRPLEQTARLCNMQYLPPFVTHGSYSLDDKSIASQQRHYHSLLEGIGSGQLEAGSFTGLQYANDVILPATPKIS